MKSSSSNDTSTVMATSPTTPTPATESSAPRIQLSLSSSPSSKSSSFDPSLCPTGTTWKYHIIWILKQYNNDIDYHSHHHQQQPQSPPTTTTTTRITRRRPPTTKPNIRDVIEQTYKLLDEATGYSEPLSSKATDDLVTKMDLFHYPIVLKSTTTTNIRRDGVAEQQPMGEEEGDERMSTFLHELFGHLTVRHHQLEGVVKKSNIQMFHTCLLVHIEKTLLHLSQIQRLCDQTTTTPKVNDNEFGGSGGGNNSGETINCEMKRFVDKILYGCPTTTSTDRRRRTYNNRGVAWMLTTQSSPKSNEHDDNLDGQFWILDACRRSVVASVVVTLSLLKEYDESHYLWYLSPMSQFMRNWQPGNSNFFVDDDDDNGLEPLPYYWNSFVENLKHFHTMKSTSAGVTKTWNNNDHDDRKKSRTTFEHRVSNIDNKTTSNDDDTCRMATINYDDDDNFYIMDDDQRWLEDLSIGLVTSIRCGFKWDDDIVSHNNNHGSKGCNIIRDIVTLEPRTLEYIDQQRQRDLNNLSRRRNNAQEEFDSDDGGLPPFLLAACSSVTSSSSSIGSHDKDRTNKKTGITDPFMMLNDILSSTLDEVWNVTTGRDGHDVSTEPPEHHSQDVDLETIYQLLRLNPAVLFRINSTT